MVARLWARYHDVLSRGDDQIYECAHFPESLFHGYHNDAIQNQEHFGVVPIEGGWREIDTVQDYDRVQSADGW